MIIHSNMPKIEVPKGKRSVRETVYGNTNAYVGGKFWKTIGPTHKVGTDEAKQAWLSGEDKK